jgi:Family of unknown function (DUF6334)
MSTLRTKAAEALYPLLNVFHEVDGTELDAVSEIQKAGETTEIRLKLGERFLVIRAESDDTATLFVDSQLSDGDTISDREPWSAVIGRRFGWGWVMVNQQGYLDGVLLSFGGVMPEVLIAVVASGLKVKNIA